MSGQMNMHSSHCACSPNTTILPCKLTCCVCFVLFAVYLGTSHLGQSRDFVSLSLLLQKRQQWSLRSVVNDVCIHV